MTQASVFSAFPRSSRVRPSRPSVSSRAAVAAASLTRISPAPACPASRAAVLTASPSAVKSSASPSPTEPTYASPVCTAAPTGIQGFLSVSMPGGPNELASCADRGRSVIGPDKAWDEEGDHFIADELVDDAVALVDDRRRGTVKPSHEPRERLGTHALGECRRASYVCEQERKVDLGASRFLLKRADAAFANAAVEPRWPEPHEPKNTAGSAKRSVAELAAGLRRYRSAHSTDPRLPTEVPGLFALKDATPLLFLRALGSRHPQLIIGAPRRGHGRGEVVGLRACAAYVSVEALAVSGAAAPSSSGGCGSTSCAENRKRWHVGRSDGPKCGSGPVRGRFALQAETACRLLGSTSSQAGRSLRCRRDRRPPSFRTST